MTPSQPGILAPLPPVARYLRFQLDSGADPRPGLQALTGLPADGSVVVGVGLPTVRALGVTLEGLRPFPTLIGPGFAIPHTPTALWCWLRGADRGELVHATRALRRRVAPAFTATHVIEAFQYHGGRDLSGFVDGTENPQGDAAAAAALVAGRGPGLDGSSFVAVQRWVHDFDALDAIAAEDPAALDAVIGRRREDDVELDDAPASAHVKRAAQEGFDPPAFVLRRSMPWTDASAAGLVFVAFGHTLDHFERLLRRMVGEPDGIVDALFRFSRPVTGAYGWCPPMLDGSLDWRAIGL